MRGAKATCSLILRFLKNFKMSETKVSEPIQEIAEGLAKVQAAGSVFYNPVQEFNRDLSIAVISAYSRQQHTEKTALNETRKSGIKYEDGISILEALSATGLRSIRYAKEIPGVKNIIANDISAVAVTNINNNIRLNEVNHLVTASQYDATMLMYQHRREDRFDVIDLDPYGCPSIFLDSAVQSIKNGGLLLVTATDMAVLAGNSPETCYVKYGAVSLKIKSCHEMALRILLQCIEAHANRYGRYIVPILSLSADFYIRVFVRIYTGAHKCKYTTSKLSHVYHCTGCDSFVLHPLGIIKQNEKNEKLVKFSVPTGPPVSNRCDHCGSSYHIGGPIWSAPLHSMEFVKEVLNSADPRLNTYKRIQGVLSVILEELVDVPLYYILDRLSGTIRVETPSMLVLRSAILNAGYKVSCTHMNKTSVKTNAPAKVVWDIMRSWEKLHPASKKTIAGNNVACSILQQVPDREYSFQLHPEANPQSKIKGLLRYQTNPLPFWGPGTRSQTMLGDQKMSKSHKNQGKRKRTCSDSNVVD
ncbi:tRNA (guanine(26)-N(2))-dimethyltransferase [Euwallacea similis]|uniref:tRNA (guanine(26)-N(2))-dimethyltransferase n=1 Tax=Euwallacea similis TaxID=1736056 RepID=UPI00344BC64B